MANENVTIKIEENKAKEMMNYYRSFSEDFKGDYIIFFGHLESNLTLTIFYSEKKGYKAFFSGKHALSEAQKWDDSAEINIPKVKVKTEWKSLDTQIGSDEVGTGDFFGPVIVVASYIPSVMMEELDKLGINDSKKLTDEKILDIVPKIENKIICSRLVCHPNKYNEMIKKGYSMNAIKAILHNQALTNVREKIKNKNVICYVDQFTSVDSYYRYLNEFGAKPLTNNIVFETKGESHYPSVAVSSMIARYSFLKYMDELSEKYHITLLKGASLQVDEVAKSLKNKIGLKEMENVCKTNFTNFEKLK